MGYNLPIPAHFLEQASLMKRPSALCTLSGGLLISAGMHFKNDRQEYRQPIPLLMPETAQRFADSPFISTNYETVGDKLTMYFRSSPTLDKSLN
jgi:hypothetical protein